MGDNNDIVQSGGGGDRRFTRHRAGDSTAARGAAVCVNYAARADAAEAVVNGIKGAGWRAIAVAADGDAVTSMSASPPNWVWSRSSATMPASPTRRRSN